MHMQLRPFIPAYAVTTSDNDALIPELWAQESLMLLENNLVMGNLVHRDYSSQVAKFGDVVNAHRPKERNPTRKTDADEVSSTAAETDGVPVPLNQHIYDSFIIKDGEESMTFKELVSLHLQPTIMGMAQFIDSMLTGQVYQFIGANSAGKLGTAVDSTIMTAIRRRANDLRWPMDGRNFVLPAGMEEDLLNTDLFVSAEKVGDDGTALRDGSLGRKFGLNTFMDQNAPSIATGNTVTTGAVDNAAGYGVGATTLVVDGITGEVDPGTWIIIAGDATPQMITAQTATSGDTTGITISPGLRHAVADDAVITLYSPGAVDFAENYAAGYSKDLVVDGFSVAPQVGQLVTFGNVIANKYASLTSKASPTTTRLMLDRPLVAGANDDVKIGIGPAGEYGFAFHKNALALVNRPLAAPMPGTGARAFVAEYNGLGIRVVITYDGKAQGHRVTVDMLAGVATLDSRLGFPVYA